MADHRSGVRPVVSYYRALTVEVLPDPTTAIDGPIVAHAILAFAHEVGQRGIDWLTLDSPSVASDPGHNPLT